MRKSLGYVFVSVLVMYFLNSCSEQHSISLIEDNLSNINPPLVLCGIDGSRSYDYLEASKDKFRNFVNLLPAETSVCIRWITEDSYQPSNAIITLNLPSIKRERDLNVFDKRKKILLALQRKKLQSAKEEILMRINRAQNPSSGYTDILGFLVLCAERISQENGREVYIIISSDLKNNVDKYLRFLKKDSLINSHIYVLAYEHTDPKSRIDWTDQFTKWGAKEIRFFAPDEEMPSLFEARSIKGSNL